jgi:nitrate reductase cytochrome c-type subunit
MTRRLVSPPRSPPHFHAGAAGTREPRHPVVKPIRGDTPIGRTTQAPIASSATTGGAAQLPAAPPIIPHNIGLPDHKNVNMCMVCRALPRRPPGATPVEVAYLAATADSPNISTRLLLLQCHVPVRRRAAGVNTFKPAQ